MNLPSLTETVELIYSCIKTSKTQPQLATCKNMIESYIMKQYKYYEDEMTLTGIKNELDALISDIDKQIAFEAGQRAEYVNAA